MRVKVFRMKIVASHHESTFDGHNNLQDENSLARYNLYLHWWSEYASNSNNPIILI